MASTSFLGTYVPVRSRPAISIAVALAGGVALYQFCSWRTKQVEGGLLEVPLEVPLEEPRNESVVTHDVVAPANKAREDCDCAPLWNCMTAGRDCAELRAELESCLASSRLPTSTI